VDRHERVGAAAIGLGDALAQGQRGVALAGEHHVEAVGDEAIAHLQRDRERELLLEQALDGAGRARVRAAVAGVEHDQRPRVRSDGGTLRVREGRNRRDHQREQSEGDQVAHDM